MPKGFEDCVDAGGRVKRISGPRVIKQLGLELSADQYANVCWDKQNKPHVGEVHTMEKSEKRQAR